MNASANTQHSTLSLPQSRFTPMKILPPADESERQALKLRMESAFGQEQGGYWRVDIIDGRYGWYVRPVRLRTRTKVQRAPVTTG